ncbi:MAG: carboxylating nicotinate-nucleotide diphosphorylase [Candidatus Omnitrophica bacterium]|nr:carboxylating nicotinate-nucleotide diphosphorylase [Candidatus Omnitrophota bacterium]MCM8806740.1 carboxylating nicotinate-nucleotide diphosphorylase [Candidatus Omnitrophota bacterium]
MERINWQKVDDLIKRALEEDIGKKDITTEALFPYNFLVSSILICKSGGIICGLEVFKRTFLFLSTDFEFDFKFKDGDFVKKEEVVGEIKGPVKELLKGERTALNFLQRLSGIATETRKFVEKTEGKIKIFDTRKTTPNLRILEKYAVKIGGGENHRFGLFDMILIKDNHIKSIMERENIDKISAIKLAIQRAKRYSEGKYMIEIEVENFEEGITAYNEGVDIIMFDNAKFYDIKRFCDFIKKKKRSCEIEVSGNINLRKIENFKNVNVDRISIGYITHSPKAIDFSLKIKNIIK